MSNPTDPRDEIASSLFEARAEIQYVLARPATAIALSPAEWEQAQQLLEQMQSFENSLVALIAA